MKITNVLVILIIVQLSAHWAFTQPLQISFTAGQWNANDRLDLTQGSYSASATSKNNVVVNLRASYLTQSLPISPVFSTEYYFNGPYSSPTLQSHGVFLHVGVEKMIEVGYSRLVPTFAIGYDWEYFQIADSFTNLNTSRSTNGLDYLAGLSLRFAFFKDVDAVFGYTFIHKNERTIAANASGTNFIVQTADQHHLLSFGISVTLFPQEQKQ